MRQLRASNTQNPHAVSGTFGELQVVSTRDHVAVDVTGRNYDVAGLLHIHRAMTVLPVEAAIRLRDMLDAAISAVEANEPRQPGLWSDSTVAHIATQRLAA